MKGKFNNVVATQIGRGNDPTGHGYYGASRSGGTRKHEGFDIISTPNEEVYAPTNGKVRIGNVYPNTKPNKPTMKLIEIENDIYRNKLMYVKPCVNNSDNVVGGQLIGHAQDITGYHTADEYDSDKYMINHVHISTWKHGLLTDSEPLLDMDY